MLFFLFEFENKLQQPECLFCILIEGQELSRDRVSVRM